MSSSNRAQLMRDGYLVKRDAIPPDDLASMRETFETLLEGRKPCGGASGVPTIRRAVPGTAHRNRA